MLHRVRTKQLPAAGCLGEPVNLLATAAHLSCRFFAWQQGRCIITNHDFSVADTRPLGARHASQPARHRLGPSRQPGTCHENFNVEAENCLSPRARCASQAAASPQAPAQKTLSLAELPVPAALAGLYGLTLNVTQPPEGGTAFAYRGRTWWCALQPQVPCYKARCTRDWRCLCGKPSCVWRQRLPACSCSP